MDRDSFNFTFPIFGNSSAPETSLVPFPISDPNILLPKLEPPLSPSYTHCLAGNLPALRSFESPSSFDSYFSKLEPLPHHFPQNLPSFETPTSFDSYFTNLISTGSNNHQMLQPENVKFQPTSPRGSKRKRSERIGDKYRSLKKLMPLDKRMDTSTMLGEAYKYVKFLQAQLKVLENMPEEESGFRSEDGALGSVFGAIGELSRSELLQVVLNSPQAQNMLCCEGSWSVLQRLFA
ncbi:basic helix-loop-helix (bHLH) DNA-binding superfamily protein [Euphorbia peplus]|nr:basic helix-loop-helix (bHLH) DNA-binding superfamily protein [Euphorbia peplus]